MRQATRRICRYCHMASEEYGVIYGNPTDADRARGHDPKINRDMDAHERVCEQNPNRRTPIAERLGDIWRKVGW